MSESTVLEFLIKAQNQANQVFDQARKGIGGLFDQAKAASRGMTDFMSAIGGVNQVLGIGRAVIDQTIGRTMEYAGQIRELSLLTGANAEESSKLIQAADDMGISYGTLQQTMEAAVRRGVDPSIEGMARLADQYNAISDPIQRSKFLMDTFGRSGAELAMLMREGSNGIRELGRAAEDSGLVMTQTAINGARELEMQIDALNDQVEAVKINIGNAFIPVAVDALDVLISTSDEVKKSNLQWTQAIPVLGGVVNAYIGVKNILFGTADAAKAATAEVEKLNQTASGGPVFGTRGKLSDRAGYGNYYTGNYNTGEPGRASGGPMWAGVTRWVGENGPEPFTPTMDGWIGTPPGGGGGSVQINLSFPSMFPPSNPGQLVDVLRPAAEQVVREMRRNGQI